MKRTRIYKNQKPKWSQKVMAFLAGLIITFFILAFLFLGTPALVGNQPTPTIIPFLEVFSVSDLTGATLINLASLFLVVFLSNVIRNAFFIDKKHYERKRFFTRC